MRTPYHSTKWVVFIAVPNKTADNIVEYIRSPLNNLSKNCLLASSGMYNLRTTDPRPMPSLNVRREPLLVSLTYVSTLPTATVMRSSHAPPSPSIQFCRPVTIYFFPARSWSYTCSSGTFGDTIPFGHHGEWIQWWERSMKPLLCLRTRKNGYSLHTHRMLVQHQEPSASLPPISPWKIVLVAVFFDGWATLGSYFAGTDVPA